MIEVLVDAGFIADERLVTSERYLTDPDCPGYSITVEPEVPPGHSGTLAQPGARYPDSLVPRRTGSRTTRDQGVLRCGS
jgi:hypothetical protein